MCRKERWRSFLCFLRSCPCAVPKEKERLRKRAARGQRGRHCREQRQEQRTQSRSGRIEAGSSGRPRNSLAPSRLVVLLSQRPRFCLAQSSATRQSSPDLSFASSLAPPVFLPGPSSPFFISTSGCSTHNVVFISPTLSASSIPRACEAAEHMLRAHIGFVVEPPFSCSPSSHPHPLPVAHWTDRGRSTCPISLRLCGNWIG